MQRRQFLAAGSTALGASLAGCTGGLTAPGSTGDVTHTVTMEPVGEVEFSGVPETAAVYCPGYADMLVALGHADAVQAVGVPGRYHTHYYDELDGVSIDADGLTALYDSGIDQEVFFEVGADVHLIDPNWLLNNFKGWEQSDVDQVADRVGPFLGNTIFRRTDDWHDYRYYTMYEAFEKVAAAFQATDRYDALAALHDEFVADVQADLPPVDDRPTAVLLWQRSDEPEQFYPYRLSDKGTNKKPFHDLGVTDALADTGISGLSTSDRGTVDYEALLDVDPDVILLRGHETKTAAEFQDTVLAYMRDHDAASQLRAVQDGRVFRGGPIYQGPLQNLFLTERFAQALYPDAFGDGPLFDRDEVAAVVTGDA